MINCQSKGDNPPHDYNSGKHSFLANGNLALFFYWDEVFFHDTSTRMIFISTWSSSTLLAIQKGDITCQTQSLRFEQSAQSQSQWRWGPGWIWKSWKKKSCSCQPPCWKQPDNHVHWDPTSPLSLSFCSTPVVPNDFPTCNFVMQPLLKHINVSSSKAIFLCFSNRKFNIWSETKAQQQQSNKETCNKIAFPLFGTTKKNDNKWKWLNSSQCNEGYKEQCGK